jgi:MinD-like ATPase involved in chromosome partitioning or flagellar assembly
MALTKHPSGIHILLSSPQPKDAILLNAQKNFEAIINGLPFIGSFVVLDLGSSLTPITQIAILQCDQALVVIEPTPKNVQQTKNLIKDLFDLGVREDQIRFSLVNRVRTSVQMNWTQVQDELGYKIDAVFTPAPELAYQSAVANQPMVVQQPGSITAQQFDKLAGLITKNR